MKLRLIQNPVEREDIDFLYELLSSRPLDSRISHSEMPDYNDHLNFVSNHPYRYWYVIETDIYWRIGDLCVTNLNEIGIHLLPKYRNEGFGGKLLQNFLKTHQPLPKVHAVHSGSWLANVSPSNRKALSFFHSCGFTTVQHTLELK